MTFPSPIDAIASWSRDELLSYQWVRMTQCWPSWKSNPFYQSILPKSLADWNAWENVPVTTKAQLIDDQDALGLGRHHTWPADHYTRFHRTSGTTGRPLVILDTAEDWNWWVSTWQYTLASAEVTADDRVFMAFSFGPFIGFWSAHDACLRRNAMVIPGGGLSSLARLDLIRSSHATIVCCTPSYALHLAEVAKQHRFPLRDLQVRQLIVAGEPGGSSPEVRQRIQSAWNANVTDHAGGTEIGPWGFGTQDGKGLYVIETEFLAEFLPLDGSSKPLRIDSIQPDELYELVLTPFGRLGSPVLRYRTGDLVRPCLDSILPFVRLEGGVLGRADDMLIIRGVNVFPSSIERILLSFPSVEEFRLIASKQGELDEIRIEVEDSQLSPSKIAEEIQLRLGLRVQVTTVPLGSLPRSEGKSKRFVDLRKGASA